MKQYRIKSFLLGNLAVDAAILAASYANGSKVEFGLENIKAIGEAENDPNVTFEIMDKEKEEPTMLVIDAKVNGTYQQAAIIELVEIAKLVCQDDLEGVNL